MKVNDIPTPGINYSAEDSYHYERYFSNLKFKEIYKGKENPVRFKIHYVSNCTLLDKIDYIKEEIFNSDCEITFIKSNFVEFRNSNLHLLLEVDSNNPLSERDRFVQIDLAGSKEKVVDAYRILELNKHDGVAKLTWTYRSADGRMQEHEFSLEENRYQFDEMYPFIKQGVDNYFQEFIESSANTLLLIGPPGVGKTSFVRQLLTRKKSNGDRYSALTTYDPSVMQDDQLYIDFISSDHDFLVLEDSDILLLTRDHDSNTTMSKLLNASDGLVKTGKKFIFTANLVQESRIEEALIRPGRCFDILKFRELSNTEAHKVAKKIRVTLPSKQNNYSLASIFNIANNKNNKKEKVGFISSYEHA